MRKSQPRPSHLQLVPNHPEPMPSTPQATRFRLGWLLAGCLFFAITVAGAIVNWPAGTASLTSPSLSDAFPVADSGPPWGFDVFIHPHSNAMTARRVGEHESAQPDDGYTFVLHNRTGAPTHFMVFAVDAHNTFFWFYPEADVGKQHQSMPLAASPITTLPESVTPHVSAGTVQFFGMFSTKPLKIAEVENTFTHGGADALRAELNAQVQAVPVDVRP